MAGNRIGGKKAAATNKRLFGEDWYRQIGKLGGQAGHTGGFYNNPELASRAGAKGGRISKRTKTIPQKKAPVEIATDSASEFQLTKKPTGLFSKLLRRG
jgi:general stress protein YciG